jgi:hypothetical protein
MASMLWTSKSLEGTRTINWPLSLLKYLWKASEDSFCGRQTSEIGQLDNCVAFGSSSAVGARRAILLDQRGRGGLMVP